MQHAGQRQAAQTCSARRTVSVFTSTIFGFAEPEPGAAHRALVDAAVCALFGKPAPKVSVPSSP
ncbi:hypothetical protein ACIQZO_19855 [Streptomyces sp. NPDC097617]|uniref:hypothetical protein n=1 Tax=Streptomyces sp. NPDC097617 TaxID=3366091 RepID=UPI00380C2357